MHSSHNRSAIRRVLGHANKKPLVTALAALIGVGFCLGGAPVVHAQSDKDTYQLDITATDLMDTLEQLGARTGFTVVYDKELVARKHSSGLNGRMNVASALDHLLQASGLTWSYVNGNTIVLHAKKPSRSAPTQSSSSTRESPSGAPAVLEEVIVTANKRQENVQNVAASVSVESGGCTGGTGAVSAV
jgi:hypothetical protein